MPNPVSDYAKRILRELFNPLGIPGALVPAYGDFLTEDREQLVYHEAGHTVVCHFLQHSSDIRTVTVHPTMSFLQSDCLFTTPAKSDTESHKAEIVVCMAGSAGVKILRGKDYKPFGLKGDIELAKESIRKVYGENLPVAEVEKILAEGEERAYEILSKHESLFHKVAAALSEKRTLFIEDVENILGAKNQSVLERSI
jgi:ATP-dependent Zn protease